MPFYFFYLNNRQLLMVKNRQLLMGLEIRIARAMLTDTMKKLGNDKQVDPNYLGNDIRVDPNSLSKAS